MSEEPPLAIELEEMTRIKSREIILLADIRSKHAQRKAALQPHPVFPIEDGAA